MVDPVNGMDSLAHISDLIERTRQGNISRQNILLYNQRDLTIFHVIEVSNPYKPFRGIPVETVKYRLIDCIVEQIHGENDPATGVITGRNTSLQEAKINLNKTSAYNPRIVACAHIFWGIHVNKKRPLFLGRCACL